jgi:hypothetical protein
VKATPKSTREETALMNSEGYNTAFEFSNLDATSPLEVRFYAPYNFLLFGQCCVIILRVYCMYYLCREMKMWIGTRQKIWLS